MGFDDDWLLKGSKDLNIIEISFYFYHNGKRVNERKKA
tara:strand:+ start:121 stop:234 length:114 start_codon:yes stop_codon:yes gene_type:complete